MSTLESYCKLKICSQLFLLVEGWLGDEEQKHMDER